MKSKLLNLFSCFLILTFAVSCGKNNKSGSSYPPQGNNFIAPNGSASGEPAYASLLAWYNAADTTAIGSHGAYTEKSGSLNFSFTMSICGPGLLNFLCEKPTKCYRKTSAGVVNGKVIMGGTSGMRYDGCDVSVIDLYSKSADLDLKEAVVGKTGRFLMKDRTQQSGSIFTVYFSDYEGSTTAAAAYKINTSIPAVLNPILKQEGSTEIKTVYLLLQ